MRKLNLEKRIDMQFLTTAVTAYQPTYNIAKPLCYTAYLNDCQEEEEEEEG